jgi:arylsulfatase A-like enzyme
VDSEKHVFGNLNAREASELRSMGQADDPARFPRVDLGGGWARLNNTPFRMFKRYAHNGGMRSPAIIRWPAGIDAAHRGAWTNVRAHLIDIVPTVLEIANVPAASKFDGRALLPLEGTSLLPALEGKALPARDIGLEHVGSRAFFRGKWKLVTKTMNSSDGLAPANMLELYDTEADPSEMNNLAPTQPERLAEMVKAWNAWAKRVGVPRKSQIGDAARRRSQR